LVRIGHPGRHGSTHAGALGQTSTVNCALEAAVFKSHRFGVICAMAVAVSLLASVTEPDQRVAITARNARGEHLAQCSSKYQVPCHDIE
jgi:hypothetical protein